MPEEKIEHFSRQDRDLLVTLHEQVKNIQDSIKELKDGTSITIADHESRLRRLEYLGALAIGGLLVLQFVLKFIVA